MKFYLDNLWMILVPLFPNFLFFTIIKADVMPPKEKEPTWVLVMTVFERIGQISCFVLPFFYPATVNNEIRVPALTAIGVFSLCYYLIWMRFFNDRKYSKLYKPFFFIPIPLAIIPVLYFISVSVLLESIPMFISAIIFAIGHLPISYREFLKSK